MKQTLLLLICLALFPFEGYSQESTIRKPVARLKKADTAINSWNPPSSLSGHVGKGKFLSTSPFYYFNLNLGYLRIFAKAKSDEDWAYTINNGFPFIIEVKPFDFASFLTSGSPYSLYVERNEWLRNFTFIVSNKTFASTQYHSSFMLWYGDFMTNAIVKTDGNGGIDIRTVSKGSPQPGQVSGILETLYPPTRDINLGVSDRIHLFQTSNMALGLMLYFEFTIPKGSQEVMKNVDLFQTDLGTWYSYYKDRSVSSDFTYGAMAGVFYRLILNGFELNSNILFERRAGDFDGWAVQLQQHSISATTELAFYKQYFFTIKYFLNNWISDFYDDTFYFHYIDFGADIRGFGHRFEWIGVGFNFIMNFFRQSRNVFGGYTAEADVYGLVPSVHIYPLAFHERNHNLRLSILYGLFKSYTKSDGIGDSNGYARTYENSVGWNYSFMLKIDYSF